MTSIKILMPKPMAESKAIVNMVYAKFGMVGDFGEPQEPDVQIESVVLVSYPRGFKAAEQASNQRVPYYNVERMRHFVDSKVDVYVYALDMVYDMPQNGELIQVKSQADLDIIPEGDAEQLDQLLPAYMDREAILQLS